MPPGEKPKRNSLVLYDSRGRIIQTGRSAPKGKQKDKRPKRREQRKRLWLKLKKFWPWWLQGKALLLEICAFASVFLAIYALRPVLSFSSATPSERHGVYGARVLVTHNGWNIRDVSVECFTNKVLFGDKYSLAFDRFVLLDEYSVSNVKSGEPFPADCAFAWSFWTKPEDGIFIYGDASPGNLQMVIPIVFRGDGLPMLKPGSPLPAATKVDVAGYAYSQVTAVDGTFVIRYRWPYTPWFQQYIVHVAARRHNDELKWRVAPESEPIFVDPSGPGSWIMTAKSNGKEWGITMKGSAP